MVLSIRRVLCFCLCLMCTVTQSQAGILWFVVAYIRTISNSGRRDINSKILVLLLKYNITTPQDWILIYCQNGSQPRAAKTLRTYMIRQWLQLCEKTLGCGDTAVRYLIHNIGSFIDKMNQECPPYCLVIEYTQFHAVVCTRFPKTVPQQQEKINQFIAMYRCLRPHNADFTHTFGRRLALSKISSLQHH